MSSTAACERAMIYRWWFSSSPSFCSLLRFFSSLRCIQRRSDRKAAPSLSLFLSPSFFSGSMRQFWFASVYCRCYDLRKESVYYIVLWKLKWSILILFSRFFFFFFSSIFLSFPFSFSVDTLLLTKKWSRRQ
jgi:hypothetical protein